MPPGTQHLQPGSQGSGKDCQVLCWLLLAYVWWSSGRAVFFFKKSRQGLGRSLSDQSPKSLTSGISLSDQSPKICSHVRDHLDEYDILSPLQHGFRERHSCESQLLLTLQDLLSWRDRGVQVDLVVLDFPRPSILSLTNQCWASSNFMGLMIISIAGSGLS